MGSVKDLEVIEPVKGEKTGKGRFIFSDRYSVFDWGEMPDHIPNKGQALCLMTAYFFEKLEKMGIRTHYRGIVEDGVAKSLNELQKPSNKLEVTLVRVIKPKYKAGRYDYYVFSEKITNCLVPLEIIYRNILPEHSSFRRRAEKGELNLNDYGLQELPAPGSPLNQPIFDVSTKLEASDRYISWHEARKLAGLNDEEFKKVRQLLLKINQVITREVERAGLKNLDGKIELAFDSNRELMVVDAVGTPDECRFSYQGFSISKETIRKFYRGSMWYQQVIRAKKEEGPEWRDKVELSPEPLPEDILRMISEMYMACANEVTGKEWFRDIPSLSELKLRLDDKL